MNLILGHTLSTGKQSSSLLLIHIKSYKNDLFKAKFSAKGSTLGAMWKCVTADFATSVMQGRLWPALGGQGAQFLKEFPAQTARQLLLVLPWETPKRASRGHGHKRLRNPLWIFCTWREGPQNCHHIFKQYSFFPLKVGNIAISFTTVKYDLQVTHLKVVGNFCH